MKREALLRALRVSAGSACCLVVMMFHAHTAVAQSIALVPTAAKVAGTGVAGFNGDTGTANTLQLNAPSYSAIDPSGNVIVSDSGNNCVRRIDSTGAATVLAGLAQGAGADTCDKPANPTPTAAQGLLNPAGVAVDAAGNLFIADAGHACVRLLRAGQTGVANLITVAGVCSAAASPVPVGLAVDAADTLYISVKDTAAAPGAFPVVRHFASDAATTVCSVAGPATAAIPACAGNPGTAQLNAPAGLALDASGELLIADTGNGCVRLLTTSGSLQTILGQCQSDGTGSPVSGLTAPTGVAVGPAGHLFTTDAVNGVVFRSGIDGASPTIIAGNPAQAGTPYNAAQEGAAAINVPLSSPTGVSAGSSRVYVVEAGNHVVRQLKTGTRFPETTVNAISAAQNLDFAIYAPVNLSVVANGDFAVTANTCSGALAPNTNGTPAICTVTATFNPTLPGLRTAPLTITDSRSATSLNVGVEGIGDSSEAVFSPGTISTPVGSLVSPLAIATNSNGDTYFADSATTGSAIVYLLPAGSSTATPIIAGGLVSPTSLAFGTNGDLYIADKGLGAVLRFSGSGSAVVLSGLADPEAIAVDKDDNLYVADGASGALVRYQPGGEQTVLAGLGGTVGANNVPATQARFLHPAGLAVDASGIIYISDSAAFRVYAITPSNGLIFALAGNGTQTTTNPGVADATGLVDPRGLALDPADDVYIADGAGNRVWVVYGGTLQGATIATLAGTGNAGASGDGGPADAALLNQPIGVAVAADGTVHIADLGNRAIRQIIYPDPSINFGDVALVQVSLPQQVQFWNLGNIALTQSETVRTSPPEFALDPNSTTCALVVPAGTACELGFTFTPLFLGPLSGDAEVKSDSALPISQISLFANGVAPKNVTPGIKVPTVRTTFGTDFLLHATIIGNGVTPVTGSVTFLVKGTLIGSATVQPDGTVSLLVPGLKFAIGTYTVTAFYSGDNTYNSASDTGSLIITRGQIIINVDNLSRHYLVPNPVLTGTVTGLPAGQFLNIVYSTTATQSSLPGNYPITATVTAGQDTSLSNYQITVNPGTLTILQNDLVVNIDNLSRAYGAANPTFTSTISGALPGDTFTVTYSTTATATSPVGTYPITGTVTGANLANYATVTVVPGTLTVTQAALNVTVNNATRVVGQPNPTFTGVVTGVVNNDAIVVTYSTTATVSSPVGTYPINASVTGAAISNYAVTVTPGVLTIVQSTPLTVTVDNVSRPYGGSNPAFTSTITGAQPGDTFTVTYATTATATSPVGTYPITATVTGANIGNYTVTVVPGTLTITQAPLSITVNNATRPVGQPNPVFTGTVTGVVNNDALTVTYSTTATQQSPAGTYPITATVTGAAAANYQINVVPGTLTITPAAGQTLTVQVADAGKIYGAALPAFTSTITGAQPGDTFTVTYATTATAASPVGTYPITATVTGANISNYTVTVLPGTLTITQAPLSITVNNATRPAGQPNPAFTGTVSGVVNNDALTVTYSTTATQQSPAGTYPITATVTGVAAANYQINVVPGTLTITPAASQTLTVQVADAGKTYGAALPAFTSTITGAQPGDTFTVTYATTATAASPVGTYPITATVTGANISNYTTVTVVPGTLTITQAPLSITVNNATRPAGQPNPAFTGTVSGVVNNDALTVTYSTTATQQSPAGTYPITAAVTGAAAANYLVSVVPGTLTITGGLTLTVQVQDAGKTYGAGLPTFTSTISGAQPGDTFTVSYSTAVTAATGIGTYPITATVTGANIASYSTVTVLPGNLMVTPAPLTVVVANATKVAGSPNPPLTGTVTGVQNGDSLVVAYSTTAVAGSPAGSYPITATVTGAAIANYTIAVTPGVLTVSPLPGITGNFTVAATPTSQPVTEGLSTIFTATVTSQAGFSGPVSLACSGLPTGAACQFSPALLTLTANGQSSANVMVVTVAGNARVAPSPMHERNPVALAMTLPLQLPGAFALFGAGRRRTRKRGWMSRCVLLLIGLAAIGSLTGCGCGIQKFKIYDVTITATSTAPNGSVLTQATTVQLGVVQAP